MPNPNFNLSDILQQYSSEDLSQGEYDFLDTAENLSSGVPTLYHVAYNKRDQTVEDLYASGVVFNDSDEDRENFRIFLFENFDIEYERYDDRSKKIIDNYVDDIYVHLIDKLATEGKIVVDNL